MSDNGRHRFPSYELQVAHGSAFPLGRDTLRLRVLLDEPVEDGARQADLLRWLLTTFLSTDRDGISVSDKPVVFVVPVVTTKLT